MKNRNRAINMTLAAATLLVIAALAAPQPTTAAEPPTNRTYFIVALGVATDVFEAYQIDVGCLRFTRDELCDTGDDCGAWWYIEDESRTPRQWAAGFEFELIDDETGLPVDVEGRGRIDGRGPKSSFAAVATGVETTSGETINFAIAGRAVGPQKCRRLVNEYEEDLEQARQGGLS